MTKLSSYCLSMLESISLTLLFLSIIDIFHQQSLWLFFFFLLIKKLLHEVDKIYHHCLWLYLRPHITFDKLIQKFLKNFFLCIHCDISEYHDKIKHVLWMVSMSPYEIVEHFQCIILIVKYFYDFQKLLKLIIFPSSNFWKFF